MAITETPAPEAPKPGGRKRSSILSLLTILVVVATAIGAVIFVAHRPIETTKAVAVNPFTGSTVPLGDYVPQTDSPATTALAVTQTTVVNGFVNGPQQEDDGPCPLPAVTDAQLNSATIQKMTVLLQQMLVHRNMACLHEIATADAIGAVAVAEMMQMTNNPLGTEPFAVTAKSRGLNPNGDAAYDLTAGRHTVCSWIKNEDGAWKFDGSFPDFNYDNLCSDLGQ